MKAEDFQIWKFTVRRRDHHTRNADRNWSRRSPTRSRPQNWVWPDNFVPQSVTAAGVTRSAHRGCACLWGHSRGGHLARSSLRPWTHTMSTLIRYLRYAVRTLTGTPGSRSLSTHLGLGIGANTAIFSLMDQVLLRLLPVKDPR